MEPACVNGCMLEKSGLTMTNASVQIDSTLYTDNAFYYQRTYYQLVQYCHVKQKIALQ